MALLTFEFFFRLLWGWNIFLLFISRAESTEDFLRVSARFTIGLGLVSLAGGIFAGLGLAGTLPVLLLMAASIAYLSLRLLSARIFAASIILFVPLLVPIARPLWMVSNQFLASLALGGAFMGQFLGHWYLNVPNIHIREFKRITNFALGAIALRTAGIVIFFFFLRESSDTTMLSSGEFFSISGDVWYGMGSFGVLLFASRVLWGLVTPFILTWMAKKTVNMRSTQSATGIFYANSVLMLLGELCALYLEKELKWPI